MQLLFSNNILEVLAVLVVNRQEFIHQAKIAKLSGLRRIQIQRALQRLLTNDLIEEYKQGNMVCYRLREEHPLFPELKSILYKTLLIAEPFKKAFESASEQIGIAFIYGSFASGTETAESDIDLFVVGDIGLKTLSKLLAPLARQLQREINPVVYTKTEFIRKLEIEDHFVTSVKDSKKLWIVGNENEFRKMDKRK